jgi:hypothetical protein
MQTRPPPKKNIILEACLAPRDCGPRHHRPEPVFNLHTAGPHNFIAEAVLAHNVTELRWLRTWGHHLVVDPFHNGAVKGLEVYDFRAAPTPLPFCSH